MSDQRGRAPRRLVVAAVLAVTCLVVVIAAAVWRHGDTDPQLTRALEQLTTLPAPAGFGFDADTARKAASVQFEVGSDDPDVRLVTRNGRPVASRDAEQARAAVAWSVELPRGEEATRTRACSELQAELARLNSLLHGSVDTTGVRDACLSPTTGGATNSILPGLGKAGHYSWGATRSVASDGTIGLHVGVVYNNGS